MITVTFPDGTTKQFPKGTTCHQVAESIGPRLAQAALAAKVNGTLVDTFYSLNDNCQLQILTWKDEEGKNVFRHSSTHLMAQAIKRLFPDVKLTIGPVVDEGFYYDMESDQTFSQTDFPAIEAEMEKIVREDFTVTREELSKHDALKLFKDNPYKIEMINEMDESNSVISVYTQGEFKDLCRGPHVPRTGLMKAFKLMKVAGAYWRADAKNKQLQRIYGISFPDKKELDAHLKMLEEAEKRDHRKLGKELELFMFDELSPGSPFFLPKGAFIYNALIDFIRQEYVKRGYSEVITPQIYNKQLWETSGHWQFYKDDMFVLKVDNQEFAMKPMNCPSHLVIYNSTTRSYRDLPLRIADFCMLHRNEIKGALGGLMRVRKFAQDDGHIFCTEEQTEQEIQGVLEFIKYVWEDVFGFKLDYYLSTKPDESLGTKEEWDAAEEKLRVALEKAGITYGIKAKDGAFYGPKIDIQITDAFGRKWQCPTCQLDFNLPGRFDATYEGSDGKKHRTVMIHRAVLGSMERFIGIFIEHFAGKFPLWLSPVQITLLPIADRHIDYCHSLKAELKQHGLRVDVDVRAESMPKKVRDAQLQRIPLMVTIGDKEMENGTLAIRTLDGAVKFGVKKEDFISRMLELIKMKALKIEL